MNSAEDRSVRYLTVSDLYNLNSEVTEGNTWVRDMNLLGYAARRPELTLFGQEQYPTIVEKAAALLHSLAYHHLFIDGNKRTAVRAVAAFLELNDYRVTWDEQSEYAFVLEVALGQHDVPQIVRWLEQYVQAAD